LDVWIALLLELRFVLEDQEAAGVVQPREVLRRAARADAETSRLAPMSLRAWHDRLSRHEPSGQDDLPEVVMPARLALRLAPGQALAPLLVGGDISLAIECDRAAARHGRTLESWALASALKRSADT
jgi:hypothetical protein